MLLLWMIHITSDNYIGDEGAKRIAEVLEKNTTLTHIDLSGDITWLLNDSHPTSGNLIGDEGVERLAEALEKNRSLTEINISRELVIISRVFPHQLSENIIGEVLMGDADDSVFIPSDIPSYFNDLFF